MSEALRFDPGKYEIKTCEAHGKRIVFRAFENIPYCARPVHEIQKLSIFAPEQLFQNEALTGYTLKTAPIFMPNAVGGYLEGRIITPGMDERRQVPNAVSEALCHGYVVVCAGIRGRNTGCSSPHFVPDPQEVQEDLEKGRLVGRAPAMIVDMKAAIRYLRHNAALIPGDPEKIITNGTSAGGALSALAGATGNHADYLPYLSAIGAADEKDHIFAASCYCPIHNLEHADMAYEWLFCGENESIQRKRVMEENGPRFLTQRIKMSEKQTRLSKELKAAFPDYLNRLALKDSEGASLTLDADGNGSFRDYIKRKLIASFVKEQEKYDSAKRKISVPESELDEQTYFTREKGAPVDMDWQGFVHTITRMKATPAFDALDLCSPENDEFGTDHVLSKHFTAFSQRYSEKESELADPAIVRMMNPTRYIAKADTAPHWRIRHGSFDRDTSLAIPAILALMLENAGYDVDFEFPWGVPHSGDYDLDELFRWIDTICNQ